MRPDEGRDRILNAADQTTADFYQRFLCNKGGCFLTKGIPRAINVTLLPTPVSETAYNHLVSAQGPLNTLIELSSRDVEFVTSTIEPSTKVDYFAKRLLQIYKQCVNDADQITLGMYRHDYMFHTPNPLGLDAVHNGEFKMVEANLMSAALLGTGTHVMELHNQVLGRELPGRRQPFKKTLAPMIGGVVAALKLYNRPGSVFLFLVAPDDFNWFDQQKMIDLLWDQYGIQSLKMTYEEFMVEGELRENRYYVRGKEVGIFYFRSMFNVEHFKTETHWEMRLKIEQSLAVKVPNIRHQCINLKLFQQAYLNKGIVERYLSGEDSRLVRSIFAELHQLAPGPDGDRAAQLAYDDPKGWVLKPSREGGGNNIWEGEMVDKLRELHGSEEREVFVLMQRLNPPHVPNRFIRCGPNEKAKLSEVFDTTGELGLFCVYVADSQHKVLVNEVAGPLIRTKPAANNEGGIAIGIGVMDSAVFAD